MSPKWQLIEEEDWPSLSEGVKEEKAMFGLGELVQVSDANFRVQMEVDFSVMQAKMAKFNSRKEFREALLHAVQLGGYDRYYELAKQICRNREDQEARGEYERVGAEIVRRMRRFMGFSEVEATADQLPATIAPDGIRAFVWEYTGNQHRPEPSMPPTARHFVDHYIGYLPGPLRKALFSTPEMRRREQIETAIRRGAPVPYEDLMQFPDLVAKYGF